MFFRCHSELFSGGSVFNYPAGDSCLFAATDITKTEDVEAALAKTKVSYVRSSLQFEIRVPGTFFTM